MVSALTSLITWAGGGPAGGRAGRVAAAWAGLEQSVAVARAAPTAVMEAIFMAFPRTSSWVAAPQQDGQPRRRDPAGKGGDQGTSTRRAPVKPASEKPQGPNLVTLAPN